MLKVIQRFGKHCSDHLQHEHTGCAQPINSYPQNSNCNVCRNGQLSTFVATSHRKPKMHSELQLRQPKNKKYSLYYTSALQRVNIRLQVGPRALLLCDKHNSLPQASESTVCVTSKPNPTYRSLWSRDQGIHCILECEE
jgi:hypothetical protein